MFGCWTRPGTTSIYTKEKVVEWPWRLTKDILRTNRYTDMIQRVLRWERQERWYGRKRQGPMARKCYFNIFLMNVFGGHYIQLFPLGKAHKAYFSKSIWCNESWEASLPSTCLDHIIAQQTYHFLHALSLKLGPTCFIKQCGTSRTQEFEYAWWSRLQIMLNV